MLPTLQKTLVSAVRGITSKYKNTKRPCVFSRGVKSKKSSKRNKVNLNGKVEIRLKLFCKLTEVVKQKIV
jgi:hypothetical protein